jgi:hypothetical protein
MPHFIARGYEQLLNATTAGERVAHALHIYDLGLRVLTSSLVTQYLTRDLDSVYASSLTQLLARRFFNLTSDVWPKLFFGTLQAYEGNKILLFMPELYDFFWDSSADPPRPRLEVREPFEQLTQAIVQQQMEPTTNPEKLEALASNVTELLFTIFEQLRFIGNYDLVYVVGEVRSASAGAEQEGQTLYQLELHKGLAITPTRQLVNDYVKLQPGWFYMRKQLREFLPLHPLLILWKGGGEELLLQGDIGVYHRFMANSVEYLLTALRRTLQSQHEHAEFIEIIQAAIDQKKRFRSGEPRVEWYYLREVCAEITLRRTAAVQAKYNQDLYFPRGGPRDAIDDFLSSPSRCFILSGRSGVGKSNFLYHLQHDLQTHSHTSCTLMYDGGQLGSRTLAEVIQQDLLLSLHEGPSSQSVWQLIAPIAEVSRRSFLLIVDGINESPNARELLVELNELIQGPWPWLKVVISSRPETWQTIKRGVKLAEAFYYRGANASLPGVEFQPFNSSTQLDPFSDEELAAAYELYQRRFGLQTEFTGLPQVLKETLSDPLNLRIIAAAYRGKAIPATFRLTELIEHYKRALIESERLAQEDLKLLEERLVPLLLGDGRCQNTLSFAEIAASDQKLPDRIYNEQVLNDGRRANRSFTNLLDADILTWHDDTQNQIRFKYERFYEYFVGRRINSLAAAHEDKAAYFRTLIAQTVEAPFLWGAIKSALIQRDVRSGLELLEALCAANHQRVKEMMVSVLTELGRDNRAQIEQLLTRQFPPQPKTSTLARVRLFLNRSGSTLQREELNSKKIAIEVACNLAIIAPLRAAILHTDPTVRAAGVRSLHAVWQQDQALGFVVLEQLVEEEIGGIIPNAYALEAVLILSLVIFFDNFTQPTVLQHLRQIWKAVIAKGLHVLERPSRWERAIRDFIRNRLIELAVEVIFRLFKEFPSYSTVNYQDIEAFFHLEASEKELYRRMVQYVAAHEHHTLEEIEEDLLAVLRSRSFFIGAVTVLIFTAKLITDGERSLPTLRRFFERAQHDPRPSPFLVEVPLALASALHTNPSSDALFACFFETMQICQSYYVEHPSVPGLNRDASYKGAEAMYLGFYLYILYQRERSAVTPWLAQRITDARTQRNTAFFERLLTVELPTVGLELRTPQAALSALELLFREEAPGLQAQIHAFLSRLHLHYPHEVDDFLEQQQAKEYVRAQIAAQEPSDQMGSLIGNRSLRFFQDLVLEPESGVKQSLIYVLEQAAVCRNSREWSYVVLREVINKLYGQKIL